MAGPAIKPVQTERSVLRVPAGTDLVEWYFEQGWTDGLPVVAPTRELVDAFVEALGGDPLLVECEVPPRHGSLTREGIRLPCGRGLVALVPLDGFLDLLFDGFKIE